MIKKNSAKSNNSSFWYDNTTPISIKNQSNKEIPEKNQNISFDLRENKSELINKVYSIQNKVKAIPSSSRSSHFFLIKFPFSIYSQRNYRKKFGGNRQIEK